MATTSSTSTFDNVIIEDNLALSGGGVLNQQGDAIFNHSLIRHNRVVFAVNSFQLLMGGGGSL